VEGTGGRIAVCLTRGWCVEQPRSQGLPSGLHVNLSSITSLPCERQFSTLAPFCLSWGVSRRLPNLTCTRELPLSSFVMSWQSYVDSNLMGSGKVQRAGIFGLDGSLWASSAGFSVRK